MSLIIRSICAISLTWLSSIYFPVAAYAAPLNISNVKVLSVTKSSARISWDTSVPSSFRIQYGPTKTYGYVSEFINRKSDNSPIYATHHVWFITGLSPSTLYHFCPNSSDQSGNTVTCDGTSNNFTVTTKSDNSIMPELPRTTVDTTMPQVTGQTFNVAADCSNLQEQINAAAAANGSLTHQVIIPAGTKCYGSFKAIPKSAGSGWIIVRTSTPDAQLPAENVRIKPSQKSLLATIVGTGWTNAYSGLPNIGWLEPCEPEEFWSANIPNGGNFDVMRCNSSTKKFIPVSFTSGTTVPTTCSLGSWFYKTNEPSVDRRAWYCHQANIFVNMAFRDDSGTKPAIDVRPGASRYRFIGLEITHLPTKAAYYRKMDYMHTVRIDKNADHIIVDRNYIHGQGFPSKEWYGIEMEGSHVAVINSYIDNFTYAMPDMNLDMESRAISISWGPGPGKIKNNYISALGISVFWDDEGIAGHGPPPADYEFLNNLVTRDDRYRNGTGKVYPFPNSPPGSGPANDGNYYLVRQLFELKTGQRFRVDGNIFDGNWSSVTQGAAICLTPTVGFGTVPDENPNAVTDLTLTNNIIKNVPQVFAIASIPFSQPPAPQILQRMLVANNLAQNINGWLVANPSRDSNGAFGYFVSLEASGEDIIFTNNTVYQLTGSSPGFFIGSPPYILPGSGLKVQNNIVANMGFGYTNSGASYGTSALDTNWKSIPNRGWRYDHNVWGGPFNIYGNNRIIDYPADNFWPNTTQDIGFTDPANGDFSLRSSSEFKALGSDGKDPGVDMQRLRAATINTIDGQNSIDQKMPSPPKNLQIESSN